MANGLPEIYVPDLSQTFLRGAQIRRLDTENELANLQMGQAVATRNALAEYMHSGNQADLAGADPKTLLSIMNQTNLNKYRTNSLNSLNDYRREMLGVRNQANESRTAHWNAQETLSRDKYAQAREELMRKDAGMALYSINALPEEQRAAAWDAASDELGTKYPELSGRIPAYSPETFTAMARKFMPLAQQVQLERSQQDRFGRPVAGAEGTFLIPNLKTGELTDTGVTAPLPKGAAAKGPPDRLTLRKRMTDLDKDIARINSGGVYADMSDEDRAAITQRLTGHRDAYQRTYEENYGPMPGTGEFGPGSKTGKIPIPKPASAGAPAGQQGAPVQVGTHKQTGQAVYLMPDGSYSFDSGAAVDEGGDEEGEE